MATKACDSCRGAKELPGLGMIGMVECPRCKGVGHEKIKETPKETDVIKPFKRPGRPKRYVVENNVPINAD